MAEEFTAFWLQFHHPDGEEYLIAGVAELKRLFATREKREVIKLQTDEFFTPTRRLSAPTAEQKEALRVYAVKHGHLWNGIKKS
ncbi:hypothetical protein GGE07_001007 [Sinorhizobium terangae]|uniref:Uncharacterized protein n=1 Tax=Sinorhizobium terangae TaxID=110322 RepID=A0A6N7LN81_SINTE|nr:hypothetical protein [Sinorhizobium terangae]MBB4184381.1 hypothetical protein [Sinorhizobium terangae]MQX19126.1 hypothetical protein [Sinorhizobium terangae]